MGTFRLTFDIKADADPSDLLDRIVEFSQKLAEELEEGEDFYGNAIPNEADPDTCSVELIEAKVSKAKGGE
tara:strand:- start:873 stop:1085 length:213 start_codon:yes stop_codon:yes gene_type:complete